MMSALRRGQAGPCSAMGSRPDWRRRSTNSPKPRVSVPPGSARRTISPLPQPVSRIRASAGPARPRSRAVKRRNGEVGENGPSLLFRLDITEASTVGFDDAKTKLVIEVWTPGGAASA